MSSILQLSPVQQLTFEESHLLLREFRAFSNVRVPITIQHFSFQQVPNTNERLKTAWNKKCVQVPGPDPWTFVSVSHHSAMNTHISVSTSNCPDFDFKM